MQKNIEAAETNLGTTSKRNMHAISGVISGSIGAACLYKLSKMIKAALADDEQPKTTNKRSNHRIT